MRDLSCPCGTGKPYAACCGIFISGTQAAPTPETLMRSRYTAYHQKNVDYIANTMKSPASDGFDKKTARQWAERINLTRLNVVRASQDGKRGIVEFFATYTENNTPKTLHEISEFRCDNGLWYYIDQILKEKPEE